MAHEATVLAAWDSPEGLVQQMLYQFPIERPIQANGQNVVPTPSSSLPAVALRIELPSG